MVPGCGQDREYLVGDPGAIAMPNNQIVIPNGDKMRKMLSMILPILVLIITGAIAWANLGADIEKVDTSLAEHKLTACEKQKVQDRELAELKREGTRLSHSNEKRLISLESDVQYTKETVKRIEKIVESIAQRPH